MQELLKYRYFLHYLFFDFNGDYDITFGYHSPLGVNHACAPSFTVIRNARQLPQGFPRCLNYFFTVLRHVLLGRPTNRPPWEKFH